MENEKKIFKITFMSNEVLTNLPANAKQAHSFHRVQLDDAGDLFNELYESISNMFKSKVLQVGDYVFILRYLDEDGDVCAITSNSELLEALRQVHPKVLKIYVTTVKAYESLTPDLSDSNESINSSASLVKSRDFLEAPEGSCDYELADLRSDVKNNAELSGDESDYVELNDSDLNTPPSLSVVIPSMEIADLDDTDFESEECKIIPTELNDFRLNPLTVNINSSDSIDFKELTVTSPPVIPVAIEYKAFEAPPTPKVESTTSNSSLASTQLDFDIASDPFDVTKKYHSVAHKEPLQEPSGRSLSNIAAPNVANFEHIAQQSSPIINQDAAASSQQLRHHSCSSRHRNSLYCRKCCAKIDGVVYKCVQCHHYNLCESCEAKADHPISHPMIKVRDVANTHLRHAKITARLYLRNYQSEYNYSQPKVSDCPSLSELNASILGSDNLDHLTVKIGENVTKSWTILNSGQAAWPRGTQLRFIGGTIALASDADNEQVAIDVPSLQPGEKVHLSVLILVNNEVGTYHGSFGFYTPQGICFGQDCPVEVTVEDPRPASVEVAQPSPKFENPVPKPNSISPPASHTINTSLPKNSVPNGVSSKVSVNSPKPKPVAYTPLHSSLPNNSIARVYPIVAPQQSSPISSTPNSIPSAPVSTIQTPANEYNMYRHELVQLIQMGFDADICRYMIIQSKGDVNAAVNAILRN